MMFISIFPAIIGLTATLAVFTAVRLVFYSRSPINLSGAFLLSTMACALMGYLYQLVIPDLQVVLFWQMVQVLGINLMYPAWLIFVLSLVVLARSRRNELRTKDDEKVRDTANAAVPVPEAGRAPRPLVTHAAPHTSMPQLPVRSVPDGEASGVHEASPGAQSSSSSLTR